MNETEVSGPALETAVLLARLDEQLKAGTLTPEQLAMVFEGENPFAVCQRPRKQKELFFRSVCGLRTDLSALPIARKQFGVYQIVVPQGLTIMRALAACERLFRVQTPFNVSRGERHNVNLDRYVQVHARSAKDGSYLVRVSDCIEAEEDKRMRMKSARDLEGTRYQPVTLLERIIFELECFEHIGRHPDHNGYTLCSGSLSIDRAVPAVGWKEGAMQITWYLPLIRADNLWNRVLME